MTSVSYLLSPALPFLALSPCSMLHSGTNFAFGFRARYLVSGILNHCIAGYLERHTAALSRRSFDKAHCYLQARTKERFMESNRSNAEIIAEFKKKRTRQIMAVGPIILAFIGLLSVENNPTGIFGLAPSTILVAAFAVIISALVFSFLNWRCPSCNKYLGKAINPKFCSKCGTQLG